MGVVGVVGVVEGIEVFFGGAMIYMLTQRLKIELCRPVPIDRDKSRLALWVIPLYVGFRPTLVYVAPLGLALVNFPCIRRGEPLRYCMSPRWGLLVLVSRRACVVAHLRGLLVLGS